MSLLRHIAQEALSFCATSLKWKGWSLCSAHLVPDDSRPDLGAVSVDDDNSQAVIHKSRYLSRRGFYVLVLFFEGSLLVALKNCVPAKGKDRYGGLTRQACFVS